MKQHFEAPLTRSFMANLTGFNESYFSSLFKKEKGWSYAEYVNQIRIAQAKHMLLGTNRIRRRLVFGKNVQQICTSVT